MTEKQKQSSGRASEGLIENRLLELYLKFIMPNDIDKAVAANDPERREKILKSIRGFLSHQKENQANAEFYLNVFLGKKVCENRTSNTIFTDTESSYHKQKRPGVRLRKKQPYVPKDNEILGVVKSKVVIKRQGQRFGRSLVCTSCRQIDDEERYGECIYVAARHLWDAWKPAGSQWCLDVEEAMKRQLRREYPHG